MLPLVTELVLRFAYCSIFQLTLKSPFASALSYRVLTLRGSLGSITEVTYTFSSVYYHFITQKHDCQFFYLLFHLTKCRCPLIFTIVHIFSQRFYRGNLLIPV